MANPFLEAEERKKKEAEARRRKQQEKAVTEEKEVPAVQETPVVAEEPKPAVPVTPVVTETPAAAEPVVQKGSTYGEIATALREQIEADCGISERKVPVNVMIPPSLKAKMEKDVERKKFKSMSFLITSLLEEYYK